MNPAAWVERHARRRPDDPALADGDRIHASWGEFAARTAGAAGRLRHRFGLSPGDRVAIVMRNRPEYLEALYAIWHAGLVAVPDWRPDPGTPSARDLPVLRLACAGVARKP